MFGKELINWNRVSLIFVVSFVTAIISSLQVLLGFAKAAPGMVYMWTGHYYLDYFYYLQFIGQGLHGHFLPRQYSATDDPSLYFHLEPYVILGQIGRLFRLQAIPTYWIAVVLSWFVLAILIFIVIRTVLKNKPFYLQFSAFLFSLFSAPFYKITSDISGLRFVSFDYWSSYATFFKRFEAVPHHLIAHIFNLVVILLVILFLNSHIKSLVKALFFGIIIGILLSLELVFYPFQVVTMFLAVVITCMFYILYHFVTGKKANSLFIAYFTGISGFLILITGLIIKNYYSQTVFFQSTKGVEVGWRSIIDLETVILNLGPIAVLSCFGLKEFIKKIQPAIVLLIVMFFVSFALFYSPLDILLDTHNGRFLSPLNYILLGCLGSLGVYQISLYFQKFKLAVFILFTGLFLFFSAIPTVKAFNLVLKDKNLQTPISYLPKGIIESFIFLDKQPEKGNVLMTPSQFLGTIVPAYTDRKTYVARPSATPNYVEKNIKTTNFYLGNMTEEQALDFLKANELKFVVLTSIEGYDVNRLYHYTFLKPIFKNRDAVIFIVL